MLGGSSMERPVAGPLGMNAFWLGGGVVEFDTYFPSLNCMQSLPRILRGICHARTPVGLPQRPPTRCDVDAVACLVKGSRVVEVVQ
eukprot:gene10385-biopygen3291